MSTISAETFPRMDKPQPAPADAEKAALAVVPDPPPSVREYRDAVRAARGGPALDERALRRPEFVEGEGIPITLCDGQAWHFPRPVVSDYFPEFDAAGEPALVRGLDFGPAYEELVDRYLESEGAVAEYLALSRLALDLLRRNYRIEPADLRHLLRVKPDGHPDLDANNAMWKAISDVAMGRGPKATAGT